MYLLLNFPLPRCVSLWVVPTVSAATFVLLRAFLSWHHWVMENKNQQAAAALRHGLHCSQMAFSLWRRRLAQKVEADRRFRCHVQQMTADALRHWHSCWQSELPHPSASLVSVEERSSGNGMDKVTLLAVFLCTAPLERHMLVQESVCVTAFFWLSVGHVPYCFVVLYPREDAPFAFLPALPSVQAVCFSSWGVKWSSIQHSKFEHVSSDQTVRLCFSRNRVYLLGLFNNAVPSRNSICS